MAIAFRSKADVAFQTTNALTISKPTGTAQDDLLVALIGWNNASGTVISGVPTGWVLVDSMTGNGDLGFAVYRLVAGASEPTSYTWNLSATDGNAGYILCYSGCSTSAPIADHSIVRSTTGSVTTTAVTVPTNGWFAALFGDYNLVATFSTPTGLTNRDTNGNIVGFDSNATAAGSQSATTTITGTSNKSYGEGLALAVAGATTFTQAITATSTATAVVQKSLTHTLTATSTGTSTVIRSMQKTMTVASVSVASAVRSLAHTISVASASTVSLLAASTRLQSVTATSTGTASVTPAIAPSQVVTASSTGTATVTAVLVPAVGYPPPTDLWRQEYSEASASYTTYSDVFREIETSDNTEDSWVSRLREFGRRFF